MEKNQADRDIIKDYITGHDVFLMGPEENRQGVEKFLVEQKGYAPKDIVVDEKLVIPIGDEVYESRIDLVVYVNEKRFMVIKCAAGSLGSREREILAAARLAQDVPVPYAVVSDGKTAIVMESVTGQKMGESLSAVFSKEKALKQVQLLKSDPLPKKRKEKEAILFRSYDSMNVNR